MKSRLFKGFRWGAATVAVAFLAASSQAITFSFSQTGFSEGATLEFSFEGEDLDGNGFIGFFPFDGISEVTDFALSFSGNSLVGAFTLGFADLMNLSYKYPGDAVLGNDMGDVFVDPYAVEGIAAYSSEFGYIAGLGPLYDEGGFVSDELTYASDYSAQAPSDPSAASVPDAGGTGAMLGLAAIVLLSLRRRLGRGA